MTKGPSALSTLPVGNVRAGGTSELQPPAGGRVPRIPDHVLLRVIGRGSYGEVWLARNIMDTPRAAKIVWRRTFWHERPYEREFRGIQKFEPISRSHPGLVQVLHVGRDNRQQCFYYLMELADPVGWGGDNGKGSPGERVGQGTDPPPGAKVDLGHYEPRTLAGELARHGRLAATECVRIGLGLASALDHLHRHKLVHRDIKPGNVIFVGGMPKLADIGLVAEFSDARSYVGTEGFIPPEGPGTVAADLYSFGKLLYEISTGKDRHAFPELPGDLAEQSEADRLVELNAVLLKACQPDPALRYHSAGEMMSDLQSLQRGESVRHSHTAQRRLAFAQRIIYPARHLRLRLAAWRGRSLTAEQQPPGKSTTTSPEAYENFLLGKSSLNRSDAAGSDRAIECFTKAIELDPAFGGAYAGLARAYLWKEKVFAPGQGWANRADEAVRRALELNPKLAEAYVARGELCFMSHRQWDYEAAIKDQLRALQLKSNLAGPHEILAFVLYHCGLLEEARSELQKVLDLDIGNNLARSYMGQILLYMGKPEQALPFFADLPIGSWVWGWESGLCLFYLGRTKEAAEVLAEGLSKNPGEPAITSVQAMLSAQAGDVAEACRKIEEALKRQGSVHAHHVTYQIASTYALLNRHHPAIGALQSAAADGFPCYPYFKSDPNLAPLRQDREFAAFLDKQEREWNQRRAIVRALLRG